MAFLPKGTNAKCKWNTVFPEQFCLQFLQYFLKKCNYNQHTPWMWKRSPCSRDPSEDHHLTLQLPSPLQSFIFFILYCLPRIKTHSVSVVSDINVSPHKTARFTRCVLLNPSFQTSNYELEHKGVEPLRWRWPPARETTVCLKTTKTGSQEVSVAAAIASGISELESMSHLKTTKEWHWCDFTIEEFSLFCWLVFGLIYQQLVTVLSYCWSNSCDWLWLTADASNHLPSLFWECLPFSKQFQAAPFQMVMCN